jgi:hypothetical protein
MLVRFTPITFHTLGVDNFAYITSLPGMPAGHPFQGQQPKHLDAQEHTSVVAFDSARLPKRPFLSSSKSVQPLRSNKANDVDFNSDKMMSYDDFTNEDVGNIIMDAEPLILDRSANDIIAGAGGQKTLKELAREANSLPGIEEFDETDFFGQKVVHQALSAAGSQRPVFQFPPRELRYVNRPQRHQRPGIFKKSFI